MSITDAWLRSANGKPVDKIMTKSDRDGLSVRVTTKGRLIFQLRYRWDGKGERVDIGSYPAMSLKDARDVALFYKGELLKNRNPRIVKRTMQVAAIESLTIESLIRQWWNLNLKDKQVKADELLRTFEIYVFPEIGKLPHDEVTLHTWLSLIEKVKKKAPSISARILTYAKISHRWAVRRQLTKNTPLSDIRADDIGVTINIGDRSLSDEEIRIVFKILNGDKLHPRDVLIIKLCLLFGCRIGELVKAKVSDFDLQNNIWTIPPENHKTGRKTKKPITRPIIPAALIMIKDALNYNNGSEYLFTVINGATPLRPSGHHAIVKKIIKVSGELGHEMPHWSIHDLRKTMRTGVAGLAPPHVAEIMLGHKLPGIWQVYDKNSYITEQREAYVLWWDKVGEITGCLNNSECQTHYKEEG